MDNCHFCGVYMPPLEGYYPVQSQGRKNGRYITIGKCCRKCAQTKQLMYRAWLGEHV